MSVKVSVIVPTYCRDTELERALASLAAQTERSFEVIVVDDNAEPSWNQRTARCIALCREHFPELQLQYIQNEHNMGSAMNRNIGIEFAQGDYVTFLDDDDEYFPDKLRHQLCAMERAGADYSLTDLNLYIERGTLIERRVRRYLETCPAEDLMEQHLLHHLTGTDTLMFRRDYLQHIGGFDPIDLGDEFYLMCKAIAGCGHFCYVPGCQVMAYVHTGDNGLSSGMQKIQCENDLYAYKKNYFDGLCAKTKRYIHMRHYAVLAFAHLRMRKLPGALYIGLTSLKQRWDLGPRR